MARARFLRYATAVVLAVSMLSVASFASRVLSEDQPESPLDPTPDSPPQSSPDALPVTGPEQGGGFNGAFEPAMDPKLSYDKVNKKYADAELTDLNKHLSCAAWQTLTFSTRVKMAQDGFSFEDSTIDSYTQFSHSGGVGLNLYGTGWPMSPAGCKTIEEASKGGFTSGGEWVLDSTGKEYASMTVAFWRHQNATVQADAETAKAAIAAAAQKCISELNLPVGNLTSWPPCMGARLFPAEGEHDPKKKPLSYLVALSEEVSDSIAVSPSPPHKQDAFGLVKTALSLTNEGITKTITFFGLLV